MKNKKAFNTMVYLICIGTGITLLSLYGLLIILFGVLMFSVNAIYLTIKEKSIYNEEGKK